MRKAMKRADMLIAATPEDLAAIKAIHHRDAELISETGVMSQLNFHNKAGWDGKRPLKLVWCGNFFAGKALPLGLHALSKVLETSQVEMHIIGTGICETKWKRIAESLHLNSACIWHGMLPHSKALEVISTCDAMLFTSLKDATSTVVLEALQYGLPVICHDTCGFGAVIDETCGIKVPVCSPEHSISEFAVAILKLATNPELLSQKSIGAVKRADKLAWPVKGRIMAGLYRAAVEKEKNGK
ncbi:MAG: glycosyltransferase family 4 protein [Acidobacteria bacterium]|nr:glycosyltransferase family 4 protein [Acidobacteriota bacterium]